VASGQWPVTRWTASEQQGFRLSGSLRRATSARAGTSSAQHGDAGSERIRRELGYNEPVAPEEAIRRTIAWERTHPPRQVPEEMFDYGADDAAVAS
jgi:hypothetical protein